MKTNPWRVGAIAIAMAGVLPLPAHAADDTAALRNEVEQLRQELSELRALVKSQGQTAATKDEVTAVKAEVSRVAEQGTHAPETNSMAHLSGYGVIGYTDQRSSSKSFGMVGFSPIFHYQYKDPLLSGQKLNRINWLDGGCGPTL